MGFTEWFNEKREERTIKNFQNIGDGAEGWRNHTDSIEAYKNHNAGAYTPIISRSPLQKGLDQFTMDNYSDLDLKTKVSNSKHWKQDGVRHLNKSQLDTHIKQTLAEDAKDAGTGKLGAYGIESGTSHTLAQARAVAEKQGRGALAKDMVGHIAGTSGKESALNAIGLLTADQKIAAARGGISGKMLKYSVLGGGMFNIYTGLTSEDPITDTTTMIASNYGAQAGWRFGKAAANTIFGKGVGHASRLALGGVAGATGMLVPLAVGELVKDVTKSDSYIKKWNSSWYKQEFSVEDKSSRTALTMRQAGLQKLSSSYLNDRGMLLGNEASILKGGSY